MSTVKQRPIRTVRKPPTIDDEVPSVELPEKAKPEKAKPDLQEVLGKIDGDFVYEVNGEPRRACPMVVASRMAKSGMDLRKFLPYMSGKAGGDWEFPSEAEMAQMSEEQKAKVEEDRAKRKAEVNQMIMDCSSELAVVMAKALNLKTLEEDQENGLNTIKLLKIFYSWMEFQRQLGELTGS